MILYNVTLTCIMTAFFHGGDGEATCSPMSCASLVLFLGGTHSGEHQRSNMSQLGSGGGGGMFPDAGQGERGWTSSQKI